MKIKLNFEKAVKSLKILAKKLAHDLSPQPPNDSRSANKEIEAAS